MADWKPMGTLLGDNIPTLALVAFIPIGIGLIYACFGYFINKAVDRRNYTWAIVGGCSAVLGAALSATGITGLLSS